MARSKYILKLLDSKQYPYIWGSFRPGTIQIPRGEETYYDEVSYNLISWRIYTESTCQRRRGAFQSISVPRVFLVFYTSYGLHEPIPAMDPRVGNRPIGTLVLAAAAVHHHLWLLLSQIHPDFTQVKHGYTLHSTGDYVLAGNDFSATNWLLSTNTFIQKLKLLSSDDWTGIFAALQRLCDANTHAAKIEVGATEPEEHEPLLPDDPPSPPPA